ncbi:MAG: ligase-associated DNA damage response endonuclease PdeM [Chitinophagaceae bacterium]|nr:MAG: ligase-associated DNA damage response endonuclease PdeM [Chitinophagaceae bacterium]
MRPVFPFQICNQHLLISGDRYIFWEEKKALILSDLHLGKSAHFRKNGIGVSGNIFREDIARLSDAVRRFNPSVLILVGDLFHSSHNREHEDFLRWRNDFPVPAIELVKGNHDILSKDFYSSAEISVHPMQYELDEFSFVHDRECAPEIGSYCFTGHIHPGISIYGNARQRLSFPCFYFGKDHAILPAFGRFTGTHPIKAHPNDHVFAIADGSILPLHV